MTSWNRRLTAAQQRPTAAGARPAYAKEDVVREAAALGVSLDEQAALLALARVAVDRLGFRTTVVVHDRNGSEIQFEVTTDADGQPVARPVHPGDAATDAATGDPGEMVMSDVLTDTLVATPDLVAVFASVGHEAVWANDAFVTVIPIHEADKVWLVELLDEWSKGHYEVKVLPALVKYGRWRGRLTLRNRTEDTIPVSAVIVAHRDGRGEIEAVSMVARDLAELRIAEERAEASEARLAALVEHGSDLIAVLREDGVVRYASPATNRLLGHADDDLDGVDLLELVHPDDRPARLIDLAREDEQGIGAPVELRLQALDGSWRHLEVTVTDLLDNPAIAGVVLNARDVTERVEAVQALAGRAFVDPLTGLPNRMRLLDRLGQAMDEADASGRQVAVLLVDLDRYRSVNDAYGKDTGNALLTEVARRLDAAADEATVARLRSDEFAVVLGGVDEPADALALANRLREAVTEPFGHGGHRLQVTASIGVAFARAGQAPEALLGDADEAVHHAKYAGRDRTEVYSPEMAATVTHRRTVERKLRYALDHDGLVVHFQPIVDVADGNVVSAEALLRVTDDEGDVLSPAEFIEAAESSGLITRLGAQVFASTCAQMAAWGATTGANRPAEVSVNVSPRQLADPELPERVLAALRARRAWPLRRSRSRSPRASSPASSRSSRRGSPACASSACGWGSTSSGQGSPPSPT